MASTAEAFNRADIFGPQNRHDLTGSLMASKTDVIGRRERRGVYATASELRRLKVRLLIEGVPVEFAYSTPNAVLPAWVAPVFQSLAERWGGRPGWDSYRAKPTDPSLVLTLLNALSDLMDSDSSPPQVTPLADGGIQAEWHSHDHDLEIVVSATDTPIYYYRSAASNHEEEAELHKDPARVRSLIGLMNSK